MKKKFLATILLSFILLTIRPVYALFGVGDIVYDPAAVAQLIKQIEQTIQMIKQLEDLSNWAEIDHINLAGGKFRLFLSQYTKQFDDIMKEIEGYQNGGLLGQISRLDEVYFPYYNDWEDPDNTREAEEADPLHRELSKQILWTRVQFKHAAKVAAKIRETLPKTQDQTNVLLDDTAQAVGIMQSIKIGNQLTGMVAKNLQNLNVALTESLQAQAAEGLEKNNRAGLKINRAKEAIKDWGKDSSSTEKDSINPFEKY